MRARFPVQTRNRAIRRPDYCEGWRGLGFGTQTSPFAKRARAIGSGTDTAPFCKLARGVESGLDTAQFADCLPRSPSLREVSAYVPIARRSLAGLPRSLFPRPVTSNGPRNAPSLPVGSAAGWRFASSGYVGTSRGRMAASGLPTRRRGRHGWGKLRR